MYRLYEIEKCRNSPINSSPITFVLMTVWKIEVDGSLRVIVCIWKQMESVSEKMDTFSEKEFLKLTR